MVAQYQFAPMAQTEIDRPLFASGDDVVISESPGISQYFGGLATVEAVTAPATVTLVAVVRRGYAEA